MLAKKKYNIKYLLLGIAVLLNSSIANSQTHLKAQISNTEPDTYWALENSFSSQTTSPEIIKFLPFEKNGASTTAPSSAFYTPEYFPQTPENLSDVPKSNALWFGETGGDLNAAQRYLKLTSSELESPNITGAAAEPLAFFNMSKKTNWTLHLIVSPDPDPLDDKGPQVAFYTGDDTYNVQVLVDSHSTGTTIKVIRKIDATIDASEILITETPDARHWHQVIVRYRPRPNNKLVQTLTIDVGDQSASRQSNSWIRSPAGSVTLIGKGRVDQYFDGAIQHLALWKRALSNTEVTQIQQSLNIAPPAVPPISVDLSQPARFFMWTVPKRDTSLDNGVRDGLNWTDPIWDIEGVYPFVRFKTSFPGTKDNNAPGSPVQIGLTPTDTAKQTYQWIKYINTKLQEHATPQKSLSDGIGYSILWHNWGSFTGSKSTTRGYYDDSGAVRALMQNWRDTPTSWRHSTHSSIPDSVDLQEIHIPFYREGMSQNAFRSVEIFQQLNTLLESDITLSKPSRLHFDIEMISNLNSIGDNYPAITPCPDVISGTPIDSTKGWFCGAFQDPRTLSLESLGLNSYWGRKNDSLNNCTPLRNTLDIGGKASPAYWASQPRTFMSLLQAFDPATGRYKSVNKCFRSEYIRYTRSHYSYAIEQALKLPAMQELNASILVSEYGVSAAGDTLDSALYKNGSGGTLLGKIVDNKLDFSSSVAYPPTSPLLNDNPQLNLWQSRLGLSYTLLENAGSTRASALNAPVADVTEAIDNLYVEIEKHNLNIGVQAGRTCAPIAQSPWLPYPGKGSKSPYLNLPKHHVKWQEIARLAAFAYRRGVREFLMFGRDELVDINNINSANNAVVGLEKVFAVVKYAKQSFLDTTTTGALSRTDDNFGVPDGIIDPDDLTYYNARFADNDLEADISGSSQCAIGGGAFAHFPDGVVRDSDQSIFADAHRIAVP